MKTALSSPTVRAFLRAGLVVLIRYLGPISHPAARIAHRIAVAISLADRAIEAQGWVSEELISLEKELRKSSRKNPELVPLYKSVRGLRMAVKG